MLAASRRDLQYQTSRLGMATLFIDLDRSLYTPGETVSGEVLVHVPASISGCQGVFLRLSAFECLKWVSPHRVPQPQPSSIQNRPSSVAPPLQQLYHADKVEVSECASEEKPESGLRPRLIRTANNQFFEVEFHEKREDLASVTAKLLEGNKVAAGHYSFPFSFKTLEQWPASLSFNSDQRKAQIKYRLTAFIDPVTPHFNFQENREVLLVEGTQSHKAEFTSQVTSFLCIGKGSTAYSLAWTGSQDSYSVNSTAQLAISVDNRACSADIKSISLSLVQAHTLEGALREETVLERELGGVRAGEDKTVMESIDLSQVKGLLPTTHGKLLTSETKLTAILHYDALFFSPSAASIPLKLHAADPKYQKPLEMQKNFNPKKMAACILSLQRSLQHQATTEKLMA